MVLTICIMIGAGYAVVRSLTGSPAAQKTTGTAPEESEDNAETGINSGKSAEQMTRGQQEDALQLQVEKLSGIAYIQRKGIGFQVSEGMELQEKDILETKVDARLELGGNACVICHEDTELVFSQVPELTAGEIFSHDLKEASFAGIGIKAQDDSVYDLSLQSGSASVSVLQGEITLFDETAEICTVKAKERCDLLFDEAGQKDLQSEIIPLSAESCNAFMLQCAENYLKEQAASGKGEASEEGAFCFTARELAEVRETREAEKQKALEALAEHEADIIANGLGESGSTEATGKKDPSQSSSSGAGSTNGSGSSGETTSVKRVVTIAVYCGSILDHMDQLTPGKNVYVPANGTILATCQVAFTEGETVFDILQRACGATGVPLEYSYSGAFGSYYIEGINNLYEFDCGNTSGWTYAVNGWSPNYGCSSYKVKPGDSITWNYVCGQ